MKKIKELALYLRDYLVWALVPVQRNKKMILRYAGLLFLILFVLLTLVAKLNGENYANQVQATRNELMKLQDQINDFMDPVEIELGQQDLSVDYVISQTEKYKPKDISTSSKTMVFLHLLPKPNYPISSLGRIDNIQEETKELASYQHQIISALESVLEYNPKADLNDKTLNDKEIQLRIDNARNGLTEATNGLRKASSDSIDDPAKGKLLRNVSILTQSLDRFASTKDKNAWFKAVEKEQKQIIDNRQDFWIKETNKLFNQISNINQDLAVIERDLRN